MVDVKQKNDAEQIAEQALAEDRPNEDTVTKTHVSEHEITRAIRYHLIQTLDGDWIEFSSELASAVDITVTINSTGDEIEFTPLTLDETIIAEEIRENATEGILINNDEDEADVVAVNAEIVKNADDIAAILHKAWQEGCKHYLSDDHTRRELTGFEGAYLWTRGIDDALAKEAKRVVDRLEMGIPDGEQSVMQETFQEALQNAVRDVETNGMRRMDYAAEFELVDA